MRPLLLISAVMFIGPLSNSQVAPFPKVVLESNVLAVGEVSSVRLGGGKQPYAFSFQLRGETKEIPVAESKAFLLAQDNTVHSSSDEVLIEFKAMKPFKGALIVRDADGHEAKFDLYAGDEKLLREFGKRPSPPRN